MSFYIVSQMLPILKNIVFFMNYFIIFAGTANGIVLISFSDSSCLIEVIFIFNLCLATLLNTFISSNTFSYSFASSAELYFSFPVWEPFPSFSCLTCLTAQPSNTILNRGGRCPCLVPDLRRKAFSLSHWLWCQLWAFWRRPALGWEVSFCP